MPNKFARYEGDPHISVKTKKKNIEAVFKTQYSPKENSHSPTNVAKYNDPSEQQPREPPYP